MLLFFFAIVPTFAQSAKPDGNRFAYLDTVDPYYPHKDFPKLTTPQWVGEPGVEAVVVLAIDDMSDTAKYEKHLRPILNRLKAIDGRAPLSIMTNRVDPHDPQLQKWLAEGLSIECHTLTHPCPLLQKGDFAEAARTYHGCVDLMSKIPGNKPVAFRMPCCDSQNTPGPRFFAEMFNKTSPEGKFLSVDTSVFMLFTPDDPSLPRKLVLDPDGGERFRKYVPFPSFVNTIENYPYPYVIGNMCWEFPCVVPSDWEGQNLNKPNNPKTLEDMKAALDLVVLKQGVFNLVFHPHGWIKNDQIVELIDHAVKTHGKKVKFLNFREAQERLNKNLLGGKSIRTAEGRDAGIRTVDKDGDGKVEAVPAADLPRPAREHPADVLAAHAGTRFVDIDEDGHDDIVFSNDREYGVYLWESEEKGWSRRVMAGKAGEPGALPMIVRGDGTNNGFFVHSRSLWWQNEDTAKLPDLVDRRSFNDLLKNVEPRGKSPKASLDSIRVAPGFRVELMASEPLVADPIAFEWGADGKLWVVEMGDYPLGVDGRGKPGGVVRFLEDTNYDGKYDKATTFLDGLGFPTGVMPWEKGVLVACAPDIFYAEDTNGDGKADIRKILFTGFGEGNQQHRLNGFELGLDGWIYGANGDSGGTVRSEVTGKTVSINGRDFRFKPNTGEFEAASGQTQFGRHRDDWGNWFGNNNPNWGWHFVLAESDLRRNPHFAPPDPKQTLEPNTRLYPISRTIARFNDPGGVNHVTSANSPTPYRDDLFGPHFANSLFISEPVHNLVHRIVLEPDGATFKGRRAKGEESREFLASNDNWFRPTMMKTGPDGALWIADMYRAVIEHPQWIPARTQAKLDLRAGSKEGRIYRVVPVDRQPRPFVRLDRLDTVGLVAALDSPNGWQCDTAMRLLLHRMDRSAIAPLKALAPASKYPQARLQAVWCLRHLNGLDEATALVALADSHPQVRRNAVKAAETMLTVWPKVGEVLLGLADDADPSVRFQVALSLENWAVPRAGWAMMRIVRRDPADRWFQAAVLSSALPHASTLLVELLKGGGSKTVQAAYLEPLLALAGSLQDQTAIDAIVQAIGTPDGQKERFAPWQFGALASLIDVSRRANSPNAMPKDLAQNPSWTRVIEAARKIVGAESAPEPERLAAIRLIGLLAIKDQVDRHILFGVLKPQVSGAIQSGAIEALGRSTHRSIPERLIRDWTSYSPSVRDSVLDVLLSRAEWTGALLSSLEDTCTDTATIDPTHRARLLAHPNADIKARAEAVFAQRSGKRGEVVDAYNSALALKGDPTSGTKVFEKTCATCHKVGKIGVEVGPDLATLKDRSPQALLIAILDPNRAFEAKYANFTIATTDGRVLTGMVENESGNSVTLRRQEGKRDVIIRSDIEQMAASGQSLMPEGLEKDLTPQAVADLISFLSMNLPSKP
jgi:putative membrane-bound dehydrogenase-like protein